MFSTHGTWGWEDHDWIFMSGWAYPLTKDWSRPDLQDQNNLLGLRTKWLESHACCLEVTSDLQYLRMDGVFRGHTAVLRSAHAANTSRPACMRCVVLCHCKVVDALLTSEVCVCVCVCVWGAHGVLTLPHPPACACGCESGSVTSVRTRSWLLWRWRRGRQRRNMTHGKLSRSSESGSRVWPQLWKRARSLRWKPRCISARSFARLARPPAAHPGQPAAPLASWPRMRVYVCYNNVAKELAA